MHPKVSVIIPVFNAENYIRICISRIIKQSFEDFELLLVDDGSTDNSFEICRDLAISDSRIRLNQQENAGVSVARNTGLNYARGEFVTFIDSDDLIAEDYLEYLLTGMSGEVILSMCSHARICDYDYLFPDKHEHFGELFAQQAAKKLLAGSFPVSVCGGLFKRDMIGDLRFPVGIRNNEDKLFLYQYLLQNETGKVAFSNEKLYGYMVREGSATRSAWNGSIDIITVADQIRSITEIVHPEWSELTKNGSLKARLDVMKSIIRSKDQICGQQIYQKLRAEILAFGFPKNGDRRLQVEYLTVWAGKSVYRVLTETYYRIYSDQRRFQLNEKKTRQG